MGKGPGKCNDRSVEEQVEAVPGEAVLRSRIRHVESGKEGNRAERAHYHAHDGKTGEKKLQTLAETDATSQDQSDHAVEETIYKESEKDDGGELESHPGGHFPAVAVSDGEPVGPAAQNNQDGADAKGAPPGPLDPGREEGSFTPAESRDGQNVIGIL